VKINLFIGKKDGDIKGKFCFDKEKLTQTEEKGENHVT